MSLRDLLVYVEDTGDWRRQFALATDLAIRHRCQLSVAFAAHPSRTQLDGRNAGEMGLVPASDLARFDAETKTAMAAATAAVRAELGAFAKESGLPVRWRPLEWPASASLPQTARYADLCVMSHAAVQDEDALGYTLAEKVLFTAGRPVLMIPHKAIGSALGRHIAVAWNSSRASTRSLNDAIPLIQAAEQITIIVVNPADYLFRPGAPPIERLMEHLSLHGSNPQLVNLSGVATHAIAATLQSKAQELGADLLVAGAFGHPRVWERLLGGATRDLLDRMEIPVLMSF